MKNFMWIFLMLTSCTLLFKKPELKVEKVHIEKVDMKELVLNVKLFVKNPNFFNIDVNGIDYSINVNDSSFAKSFIEKKIEIPKEGQTTVELPVTFNTTDLVGATLDLLTGKKLTYKLVGSIHANGQKIPFQTAGDLTK